GTTPGRSDDAAGREAPAADRHGHAGGGRTGSRAELGNLCTTRCVALGVGARGAYTRGHSATRHGDVCLPEPAPRLRVRFRGALACQAPSAPTPSATITCADLPLGVGRWLPRL